MNGFYLSFLLIYKFFYYNIYSVDNLKNEYKLLKTTSLENQN